MAAAPDMAAPVREWHVYLLRTRTGALYTGIAVDVARRLAEHGGSGRRGARSLRSRGPLELVYCARIGSRALALKVEMRIKRLPKRQKEALIADPPSARALLQRLSLQ